MRARVVAETLTADLSRGPKLLARRYRREATVGLRELLASFAGQSVASASIDFRKFEAELKGRSDDEQLAKIAVEDEFLLYCDQDSFNEIARAIEAAHGITGASK